MSYKTHRYLYCDGDPELCPLAGGAWDPDAPTDESISKQRERANADGWTYKHGEDHCSTCRKRVLAKRKGEQ